MDVYQNYKIDSKKLLYKGFKKELMKRNGGYKELNFQRLFKCGCGKQYLSNPALYTHIKLKHGGNAPDNVQKPSDRKRGRPKMTASKQTLEKKIPQILTSQFANFKRWRDNSEQYQEECKTDGKLIGFQKARIQEFKKQNYRRLKEQFSQMKEEGHLPIESKLLTSELSFVKYMENNYQVGFFFVVYYKFTKQIVELLNRQESDQVLLLFNFFFDYIFGIEGEEMFEDILTSVVVHSLKFLELQMQKKIQQFFLEHVHAFQYEAAFQILLWLCNQLTLEEKLKSLS